MAHSQYRNEYTYTYLENVMGERKETKPIKTMRTLLMIKYNGSIHPDVYMHEFLYNSNLDY